VGRVGKTGKLKAGGCVSVGRVDKPGQVKVGGFGSVGPGVRGATGEQPIINAIKPSNPHARAPVWITEILARTDRKQRQRIMDMGAGAGRKDGGRFLFYAKLGGN